MGQSHKIMVLSAHALSHYICSCMLPSGVSNLFSFMHASSKGKSESAHLYRVLRRTEMAKISLYKCADSLLPLLLACIKENK